MTLLTIIQDACAEIGLPRPTGAMAATDPTVRALLVAANEEGAALAKAHDWQALRAEQTFTSVATETQTGILPAAFGRFVNGTFWNRTRRRPFRGPASPPEWQRIKASTTSPVFDTFTYRGDAILLNPVPSAGWTFAFEYISKYWCESSGGTGQTAWAADTDVTDLPERLIRMGIVWRFKQARGMSYDADYSKYMYAVRETMAQEAPHAIIDFSMTTPRGPGLVIPEGDWAL